MTHALSDDEIAALRERYADAGELTYTERDRITVEAERTVRFDPETGEFDYGAWEVIDDIRRGGFGPSNDATASLEDDVVFYSGRTVNALDSDLEAAADDIVE